MPTEFKSGDAVTITGGRLEGFTGIVDGHYDGEILVRIMISGCYIRVEVPPDLLRPKRPDDKDPMPPPKLVQPGKPYVVVPEGCHEMRVRACEADFAGLKKSVCEAVNYTGNVDQVHHIGLINEDRPKVKNRDSIFTKLGCFLAAALVAVVFISGIIKIGELIWK